MAKKQSLGLVSVVVLAIFTAMAGCHKNDGTQEVDAAAANGNLAPVGDTGAAAPVNESVAPPPASAPAYSAPARPVPSAQQTQQPQYPAQEQPYQDQAQDQDQQDQSQEYSDQPYQEGQAAEYAPDPPPPLPEYQQPPCPEPNYLWTPGYWSYAQVGYYWVPGVWVAAPYTGALWTPGYWNYDAGRYGWHRGSWGRYIGYYGGVNYGNGYVGRGYYGGYWKQHRHPQYLHHQRDQYYDLQSCELQRWSRGSESPADRCRVGSFAAPTSA
jgi:hypothetical protein